MDPGDVHILNADGDEYRRRASTRVLERHGFRVTEAGTGQAALAQALETHPRLILLDVDLPDMTGFEVCRKLKSDPWTAAIPVLFLTASPLRPADLARGLDMGAESCLSVPAEPEVLTATVNAIVRAHRAGESDRSQALEWQTTFDAITDGIAVLDAEGRVLRGNAALGRMTGRPAEQLKGEYCYRLHPDLSAEPPLFLRAVESRQRQEREVRMGHSTVRATIDPVTGPGGAVTGAVYILSDVTERTRLQEQFREGQKYETIATLAAGVAHDFNNLLTSIMGNASLALGQAREPAMRERLEEVVAASQRAADLTRQLLAYSGKGRHFVQPVDLSQVLKGMQELMQAAIPKKVVLELDLGNGLPRVDADANQVQQIVMNLVGNAAEAIGDASGTIRIRTAVHAAGGGAERVLLEVWDDGCGMTAEVQARMFDPFFTTRFTGRGLGLAAVAGIARAHRAEIEVASAPGEGATIRLLFPTSEPPVAKPVPAPAAVASGQRRTVLVVDDEDMVRQIAKATLEIRGFPVVLAANGEEAVEAVKTRADIGLVLLDLTMPVMSGDEAIDAILDARPSVKVVISTGYDSHEATSRFHHKTVAGYLQKPYTSRQLAERVKSLLETR